MKLRKNLLYILVATCLAVTVDAATITVCPSGCDYNAVGLAITAASGGDTVYVYNGTYLEHLTVNKSINLEGESKYGVIIDGSGSGTCLTLSENNTNASNLWLYNCSTSISSTSSHNTIENNILDTIQYGISDSGNHNVHINNQITHLGGNHFYGIYLTGDYNNLSGNNISAYTHGYIGVYGIFLSTTENTNISNNRITINNTYSSYYRSGIHLASSIGTTIEDNVISLLESVDSSLSRGIGTAGTTDGIRILSNNITDAHTGVHAFSPNPIDIIDNSIIGRGSGVGLDVYGHDSTIANNTIGNHTNGIALGYSAAYGSRASNTSVNNNTIYSCTSDGLVWSQYVDNIDVRYNDFRYNGQYDINLPGSSYNTIVDNTVCKIYQTETNTVLDNTCPYQTAPNITLNSPENGSYVSELNVPLNFTAFDNIDPIINCSLYLNSVLIQVDDNVTNGSETIFWLNNTYARTYSWQVNCADTDGNFNTSETWVFTVNSTILPPPILYLNFNEGEGNTTNDSSGYNNHGTLVNNPTWTTGINGSALEFDGTDDYVNLGNESESLRIRGSMTMTAWFNKTSYGQGGLIGKWASGNPQSSYLLTTYYDGSRLAMYVANGSTSCYNNFQSASQYPLNQWNYVAGVFDDESDTVKVYLNGELYSQGACSISSIYDSSWPVHVGNWGGTTWGSTLFDGIIDELKIYNRPLNASEILDNYQALANITTTSTTTTSTSTTTTSTSTTTTSTTVTGTTSSSTTTTTLSDVVINEFLPHPRGRNPEWIELYNKESFSVDLSGWYLGDEQNTSVYQIPQNTSILGGGFAIFYGDDTNITLSDLGDTVYLQSNYLTNVDNYTYSYSQYDVSIGRELDGGSEWTTFEVPTPGSSNNARLNDSNPPNITLNSPSNGSAKRYKVVFLRYTPNDVSYINSCKLYTNISGSWEETDSDDSILINHRNSFKLKNLANGTYLWNVWCIDEWGNNGTAQANYTFTVGSLENSSVDEEVNTTTNESVNVTNPDANTTVEIVTINNVSGGVVAIGFSTELLPPSMPGVPQPPPVPVVPRYLHISANSELEGEMNYAVIRFYYTDEQLTNWGLNENNLRFYWYNTKTSEWEALDPNTMSWVYAVGLNKQDNYVWATVTHFSDYVIGELPTSGIGLVTGWNLISLPLSIL